MESTRQKYRTGEARTVCKKCEACPECSLTTYVAGASKSLKLSHLGKRKSKWSTNENKI